MKTPVAGILILGPTGSTHRKQRHAGVGAVVGNRPNDGKTGTAMGAVGEGITKTPVQWIEDLLPTCRTGGGIRHNAGVNLPVAAGHDAEAILACVPRQGRLLYGLDD